MNRPLRIVVGVFVGLVASFAVRAGLGGGVSLKDLKSHTVTGVTVDLPAAPQLLAVELPADVRSKVVLMENYQSIKGDFLAAVSRIVYVAGIEANLDAAVDGSVTNVMANHQMTKVSDRRDPVTLCGIPGKRFDVVMNKSGDEYEMRGLIAAKGPKVWLVFTFFRKKDDRAQPVADRVLSSVQFVP